MERKFKFDYDFENDDLFLYDPSLKSNASVELGNLIVDFSVKKEISALEFMGATSFLEGLDDNVKVDKAVLQGIKDCWVDIQRKEGFLVLKFKLLLASKKVLSSPVLIPDIKDSPALAF